MCLVVACWERAGVLALVCGVRLWVCRFPVGVLGRVWFLIVAKPDLCTLTYFKPLFSRGLSESEFYCELVYKLKKIVGSNNFSAQFIRIIFPIIKNGYNINVLQQTACLVVNPIRVDNFAFLFNSMPVGRTSDSITVPT